MEVTRTNLTANRIELLVKVLAIEMSRLAQQAATHLSEHTTIQGFRPGKAPYEVVKARLGEMAILEETSRLAVNKTIDEALEKNITEDWIGQPQITIIKLAPDNDFEYKALVTLLPNVTLGIYKELGLKAKTISVTDDEVVKVIDHLSEGRVKEAAVDRAAEKDDKIVVDIAMSLDNVPLDGGQNKDTAVIIGKDYLVPGFDEHLIGLTKAEERTFNIHYPDNHFQKNIAGKEVSFKVIAKDIFSRELPKLDDDFAKTFGLETITELRTNIKTNLEAEKTEEAKYTLEHSILEAVVAKATISELPDELIDNELEVMLKELEHNVTAAGGKFTDYLVSINKPLESLKQELRPQAIERLKISLVVRAIIKAEHITVTEAEVNTELDNLRKHYGHDTKALETLNSSLYRQHIETLLLNRKVVANLLTWNSN